jgi:flagellin
MFGEAESNRLAQLTQVPNPLLRSGLALAGANTWLQAGSLPEEAEDGILTADITVNIASGTTTTTASYFLLNSGSATPASGTEIQLFITTSDDSLDGMIQAVDTMLSNLTDSAATLGSINMRIEMQDDFVSTLMDVIDKGIGRLVDADMNEESTRLKALQTQQQLGIQALSIANSNAENILQLFK